MDMKPEFKRVCRDALIEKARYTLSAQSRSERDTPTESDRDAISLIERTLEILTAAKGFAK